MARNQVPLSNLSSPFPARPPKHARHAKQVPEAQPAKPVDNTPSPEVKSGFSVFNQVPVQEKHMSDTEVKTSRLTAEQREELRAQRAEAKAAKLAEKEAAKAAKLAEREAKAAAKEAEKAARAEARAAAKAEREARMAELGPQGKMTALREAKTRYVKSATGQLRSTDELAEALDSVPPVNVVALALQILALPANPYERLNIGQQSMNLRNKLRGAIKRGVVTIEQLAQARDAGRFALSVDELAEMKRKAKAAVAA